MLLKSKKFLLIRHGATRLNSNGFPDEERMRGWQDVPLSTDGWEEVSQSAIENMDHLSEIGTFYSSDLKRAMQTADLMAAMVGAPAPKPKKELRPWDTGDLTGVSVKEALPNMNDFVRNKPDEQVSNGESFNTFVSRTFDGLQDIFDKSVDSPIAIVTHHRVERLLLAWIAMGCPADRTLDHSVLLQPGEPTASMQHMAILPQRLYAK